MRKLGSIIYQIVEYLLDFCHISCDKQFLTCEHQIKRESFFVTGAFEGKDGCLDHAVNIKICDIKHDAVTTKLVEIKNTLCQFGQSFRFKKNNIQVFIL